MSDINKYTPNVDDLMSVVEIVQTGKWPHDQSSIDDRTLIDCFANEMCSILLAHDVLFTSSSRQLYKNYDGVETEAPETITLHVLCSDTFGYACADAEEIPRRELLNLFRLWLEDKTWGPIKWCAFQRNIRPISPVVEYMKRDGVWCDRMDQLPSAGI